MLKLSTSVGLEILHRTKSTNFSNNRILTKLINSKSDNVYTSGFYVLLSCIFCDFSNITRSEFNLLHVQTSYCK